MPSGLKNKEIVVGTGAVATRGKEVVIHYRGFLNRGEECCSSYEDQRALIIDLDKRECIAGLRMGVEGMRVAGKREVLVSPHLAYGESGLPGRIPPNALLRFEVELLEVREKGVRRPGDYPAGRHFQVFHPGEAARNLGRWQFGLSEKGKAGVIVMEPLPDGSWRRAPVKSIEFNFTPEEMALIRSSILEAPVQFPLDCLTNDKLWSDHSEKANAVTRDLKSNTLCVTVSVWERGEIVTNYSLPETSPVLLNSAFYKLILRELEPHFYSRGAEVRANQKKF